MSIPNIPEGRTENYLGNLIGQETAWEPGNPESRVEEYLDYILNNGTKLEQEMEDEIESLKAIGRFLSLWNATTGKPTTDPAKLPYKYKAGDYYIVSVVGITNYQPSGNKYDGIASTTLYSGDLAVNDFFVYDGSAWTMLSHSAVDTGSTFEAFPASWPTSSSYTTAQFCAAVNADADAVQGKGYLGEVTWSDLPASMANAEVQVEIMSGTGASNKIIHLICTSGNQTPYRWEYTYWNNGSNVSGWIGFQPQLTAGTNITISGNTISATDTTYTAGNNIDITSGAISVNSGASTSGKVLTANGSGGATWSDPTGMTNPMTTAGDIIVGGSSGTPNRLAKGSNGQVLKMVNGSLAWSTDNTGMSNPMTTAGDIIVGGSSGTPTRLAKGSNGQVLKMVSGSPAWGADNGMTNPMTAANDLIIGGTDGVPVRLPKGSNGQYLKIDSGSVYWGSLSGVMANPMTTAGDIIIEGMNGTYTRLAKGQQGYLLAAGASLPEYTNSLPILTSEPINDNTSGIKIVVLSSEPQNKLSGYLYIITGS